MWIKGSETNLLGAWPGQRATHLGGGTFKFVLPDNVTGDESQWMIIWNNNNSGKQTSDLSFTMRGLYDINGYKNLVTKICEGGDTGEQPGENPGSNPGTSDPVEEGMCLASASERAVFFTKPSGWGSNINCYVWINGGTADLLGKWPGAKATNVGGNDYKMVIPESAVLEVDLARIAFGQTIAVTGLQLAAATASAINGGKYYKPYLVSKIYDDNGLVAEQVKPSIKNRTISEEASKILNEMLEKVVSEGSGKHAYIEGYNVAGKTGTAQKYQDGHIAVGKYISSFVGYFPSNAPKYLALVIIDEPVGQYYGSTVAAPYAKEVFEGIIELKNMEKQV
jgi:cell division protein FtsI/penicillin-binding protein 2